MRIRFLGHAAFEVRGKEGIIYIDPYLSNNPKAVMGPADIDKADLIFVTHDHSGHIGDAVEIAVRTGATVVAVPELSTLFAERKIPVHAINMGAFSEVKGVKVGLVQAYHTCARGSPVGVLFEIEGKVVYHLGDTALFRDLEVIRELYKPEIVMVPIGGFYTMGPKEAAKAVAYLKPKIVIPMHYGTFPVLNQTPESFISETKRIAPDVRIEALMPGEIFEQYTL